MPGNRITLVGFAAAEALAHAADGPPANDSAQGPVDGDNDGDDDGDADELDEAPLPEALDAQALAHIRSGSPHVDIESVPERPERVEGGWWVSMRIFVSDED